MTSPTPNQASGSDRIDQAPKKCSDHTEKVQGSHNTEQAQGSDHMELAEERESSPSYETSASDILDPGIEWNVRHKVERDPDYILEEDEVNYSSIIKFSNFYVPQYMYKNDLCV